LRLRLRGRLPTGTLFGLDVRVRRTRCFVREALGVRKRVLGRRRAGDDEKRRAGDESHHGCPGFADGTKAGLAEARAT